METDKTATARAWAAYRAKAAMAEKLELARLAAEKSLAKAAGRARHAKHEAKLALAEAQRQGRQATGADYSPTEQEREEAACQHIDKINMYYDSERRRLGLIDD